MAGLKAIKGKIRSIEKTQTVTKAMEAVSAAKMRKAQGKALAGRAYARAAVSVLARVAGSRALANNPFIKDSEKITSPLYIVITSDKGLAGALNSAVLRATLADINASGLRKEQVGVIAVGRKANDFFAARGYRVERYHPNTPEVSYELMDEITSEAANRFIAGACDMVKIAYQNFRSTFEQKSTLRTILPLSLAELQAVVGDIIPAKGAYAHPAEESQPSVYTIEPSEEEVLSAILPKLAAVFVHHALLESQASEHSARMVSMKSASDKAGELRHSLTLQFNKARQAAITREVSEITGGMETVAN